MESIIRQKIDLIAECIFDKVQKSENNSFGLYNGEFGQLLFLLYYSRYSQNEKYVLLSKNYADRLLVQFVEQEKLHTFCSGFSGILYLFEFLRENDIIDLDVSNIQPIIENYIITQMRKDISQKKYDFMHGALGVGLYFLKRKTHPEYIQELVDFLYQTAERSSNNKIYKWESDIDPKKKIIGYNLSLCHGISSIIIFLSRVIGNGIYDNKIQEMLFGAMNYISSQQKNVTQFGAYFPSYIIKNSPDNNSKSRLAWCYGDLGIGIALWQAGKAIDKKEWKEKGLEVLIQSTRRRTLSESGVLDAGICHGSAGIVLIYRRMFYETQNNKFKDAISFWINQTLNFSNFKDGLAGYKALRMDGWRCCYYLLSGISGIGLVLLSHLKDDRQDWDEMFLLS